MASALGKRADEGGGGGGGKCGDGSGSTQRKRFWRIVVFVFDNVFRFVVIFEGELGLDKGDQEGGDVRVGEVGGEVHGLVMGWWWWWW